MFYLTCLSLVINIGLDFRDVNSLSAFGEVKVSLKQGFRTAGKYADVAFVLQLFQHIAQFALGKFIVFAEETADSGFAVDERQDPANVLGQGLVLHFEHAFAGLGEYSFQIHLLK